MPSRFELIARRAAPVALPSILALALWLRLTGLGFGLPSLYHPDEPNKIIIAAKMVRSGSLNPHYFKKPTTVIYLNALIGMSYVAVGKLTGELRSAQDFKPPERLGVGVAHTDFPGVVLLGRGLMALFGVVIVWLTHALGRRYLEGEMAPLLGALAVAVSPSEVYQSHFIETNILVSLALVGVAWVSAGVFERGALRDYLWAGFLVGVATSCKYTGAVGGAFLLAAHFLAEARGPLLSRALVLGVGMVPVGFLLGTPCALLEPGLFFESVFGEGRHYSSGHVGQEGGALFWYLEYALAAEGPLMALGFVAAGLALWRKARRQLVLASFPLLYFAFIASFAVRNAQTFMPLVPFVALLGAGLLVELVRRALELAPPRRWLGALAVSALSLGGVLVPLRVALAQNHELVTDDARERAGAWIRAKVPRGTAVAIEIYAPWVPPERYKVRLFHNLSDHTPDWYEEQQFEYLVFSSSAYARFPAERDAHADVVEGYEALWRRFELVREFQSVATTVKIYRTRRVK